MHARMHLPSPPPPCSYYSLKPDIKVIAPWREWDLLSRTKLIEYAEKNDIPVPSVSGGGGWCGFGSRAGRWVRVRLPPASLFLEVRGGRPVAAGSGVG